MPRTGPALLVRSMLVVMTSVIAGCAGPRAEPGHLALSNSTDEVLALFMVREVMDSEMTPASLGRFTWVPPRSVQTLARLDGDRRLPREAIVTWQRRGGKRHEERVPVREALRGARGDERSMLVFEITPEETVSVYVLDPEQTAGR